MVTIVIKIKIKKKAGKTERGLYPKTLTHQPEPTTPQEQTGKKGNPCIQ